MKTSSSLTPVEAGAGAEGVMPPPRLCQLVHVAPSHARCHRAASVPRTNTSMRFGPHDTAPGPAVSAPPRLCQPLHELPVHAMCQSALSRPFANTSMRFGPHDTAAGAEVRPPPRLDQPLHEVPFHPLCQSAPSSPLAKTSRRFGPQDADAGLDVNPPPRFWKPSAEPNSIASRFHSSRDPPPKSSVKMPAPRKFRWLTRSNLCDSDSWSSQYASRQQLSAGSTSRYVPTISWPAGS